MAVVLFQVDGKQKKENPYRKKLKDGFSVSGAGYSNFSHFTRAFINGFGILPGRLKKYK